MKTRFAFPFRPAVMIIALAMSIALPGCSKDEPSPSADLSTSPVKEATLNGTDLGGPVACPDSLPLGDLSEAEISALMHMRSEELVARDVYLAFSALYPNPVFRNITKSESAHAEAIARLLTRYNLPDPEAGHVAGTFSDPQFQDLYNTLTAAGAQSVLSAMVVGATIEDLDIYDLQNELLVVDNTDIRFVFNNLLRGSKNHMRAFYANIVALGGTYTPQYITPAEFEAIIHP